MNTKLMLAILVGWLGLLSGCARPTRWAQPLEQAGLPNLHQVGPGVYRGAQPDEAGLAALRQLGIKTIVTLRVTQPLDHEIRTEGFDYEHITTLPFAPSETAVVRFLRIVSDPARQPVFIHCQRGADRTGMMCAAYRVVIEGWSREAAVEEMVLGGYGFSPIWIALPAYVSTLPVESIRDAAGVTAMTATPSATT